MTPLRASATHRRSLRLRTFAAAALLLGAAALRSEGLPPIPSPTATCVPPAPAGQGRWSLPTQPRVLARRAAFMLDRGHGEQRLAFSLTVTARVWAEAGGLWGLPDQDDGAAPEAFVDEAYAGPLLAEHGGGWRSPQAFVLGPGPHQLLLRVSSLRPSGKAGGAWLKALSDPVAVFHPAPTPTPCGCPEAPSRKDWPARLKGGDLVLSVLSGRIQGAGLMAQLKDRDAWECRVRLPAAAGGGPLAVVASIHPMGPGLAQLVLGVDPDYRGPAEALGYTPGAWEPLRLQWCAGRLTLRLAHAPDAVIALDPGPLGLELAAQDLELGLAPAR